MQHSLFELWNSLLLWDFCLWSFWMLSLICANCCSFCVRTFWPRRFTQFWHSLLWRCCFPVGTCWDDDWIEEPLELIAAGWRYCGPWELGRLWYCALSLWWLNRVPRAWTCKSFGSIYLLPDWESWLITKGLGICLRWPCGCIKPGCGMPLIVLPFTSSFGLLSMPYD